MSLTLLAIVGLTISVPLERGDALPDAASQPQVISSAVTELDAQIVDDALSARDFCMRMFAAISGEHIRFRLSNADIRTASYAALDRLVEFAQDCPQLILIITGHSDASGNEQSNHNLSLLRARAVADYLVARGVADDRLVVAGAGSSKPVADNTTARGRERNRRIEFAVQSRGVITKPTN